MIRVGIVVQRYGKDVVGGAETLSRDVAERLNASGLDVTVFTTTARDYITWKRDFPAGDTILKGVNIKRYDVEQERDIESFNRYSDVFFQQSPGERDENKWIREQGPYCPALIEGLRREQENIDVFLFFTYLYYPTIEGLKAVEKPAVLFPTAHDEAPIYMELMKEVFRRPKGIFFLTGAEMDFVVKTFSPPHRNVLIRTGTEMDDKADVGLFRRNYSQYPPFMLYAGRIEAGKGLETAFEAYRRIRNERLLDFVLMGKKLMDIPRIDGLKYVGFVSEEEKRSAFKGALFSLQPSPLESLSITTLESFSQRTPVVVNRQSPVLVEHIDISGGGVAYEGVEQLTEQVLYLYDHKRKARNMGVKGHEYVEKYFSWPVVIGKIKEQLEEIVRNEIKK